MNIYIDEDIVKLFEQLKLKGIIKDYALGGGIAVEYYVNPPATSDIDIFVIIESNKIDFMSPIFDWIQFNGGVWNGQYLRFKGRDLHILPAFGLGYEAVDNAETVSIGGTRINIITPDYLAAILFFVGRRKDTFRINLMHERGLLSSKFRKLIDKYNKVIDNDY